MQEKDHRFGPAVIAHRGNSSVAPQNTLAAFEAAWRSGADAIELDIRLSKDRAVVVIHNDTVDETTDGTGAVADLDLEQLRALDAGSWFSPAYTCQYIPTFTEVLEFLVAHPDIELLLELKDLWAPDDVRKVAEEIDRAGVTDRVLAQSFWPPTVVALRDVAPALRRGLLISENYPDLLSACAELKVTACNPAGSVLLDHPGLVAELHAAGLEVMVWTLDEPEQWEMALAAGVDAVITDRPDRMHGWLDAR